MKVKKINGVKCVLKRLNILRKDKRDSDCRYYNNCDCPIARAIKRIIKSEIQVYVLSTIIQFGNPPGTIDLDIYNENGLYSKVFNNKNKTHYFYQYIPIDYLKIN